MMIHMFIEELIIHVMWTLLSLSHTGIYLMVVFYLPNRAFYSQLSSIDNAQLVKKISNVLIYASLDMLSFFYMSILVHRKLKISPVHQLAFVMSSQKQFVQSKLILWVVFSV